MKDGNRTFIKIFWSYAIVIIIPIVILGVLTTGVLFKKLASDSEKLHRNIIQQSVNMVDAEMNEILTLFYRIEKNEKIQNAVEEHIYDYSSLRYSLYEVTNELRLLMADNSVFKQVGFYVENKNCVVTNNYVATLDEFYTYEFSTDNFSFEEMKDFMGQGKPMSRFVSKKNKSGEDIVLCCKKMDIGSGSDYVMVFVVLDRDALLSKMRLNNMGNEFEFAIVDTNDQIIAKSDNFKVNLKDSEIADSNGIITVKSQTIGCKYIYKLPKGGFAGNVRYISLIFLALAIVTVLVSLMLAVLHMQKIKKVFLGFFNENRNVEQNLNEQLENAKERILSNLLHNIHTDTVEDAESMSKYGINLSKKYLAVMTVSNTQVEDSEIYSSVEEIAWSELNHIVKSEIFEMNMNCEVVRTGSNSYSYILNFDKSGEFLKLKELPQKFANDYNVIINFGIGDKVEETEKIYVSYEGSVSALRFCFTEKPGVAVFYSEIRHLENSKLYYTGEKENQLIRNIKIGSQTNVEEILDEIYNVNFRERHVSHSSLKRLIYNLSLTIYKVLDDSYEHNVEKHEKYARVCQNLFRNDNSEECFMTLREICLSLCNDIGAQLDRSGIKNRIVDYLAENYSNSGLSLEMLADHLNISYHYLSRLFKEYFGTNFVSYLTIVRLEKAKELLKSTNESVEQIAKKTGFIGSNSLIRAFKKYYDVTPAKFRKNQ